ncbi:hypothetical protein C8F01DRAFT_1372891 [Mycena amicta]|nr:hypothetical protein C8F01DRAFT_1372891 [Mycena amicta]
MSASTPQPTVFMPVPQIQVSAATPPSDSTPAIERAYSAAFHAPGLSMQENQLDKSEETLSAPIKRADDAYEKMKSFYAAHASAFNSAGSALMSEAHLDPKAIENNLNRFADTSKVIMKGLDILGTLHPFIGVAVLAFKGVIALDLARRQNNKKVIAIQVQMQDMTVVLFQLRNIRDPEETGPDGTKLAARLGGIIGSIANSITQCGTACDIYLKKGFLSKTLKSKIYEDQLTAYVQMFDDNKKKLKFDLAVHTARGVDEANQKLDNQNANLNLILVRMEELFRKLDTSRERDARAFIEMNKGAQACVENEATLSKLLAMGGEKLDGYDPAQPGKADLVKAQKLLSKELAEDVNEVVMRSMDSFARKMKLQSEELAETIISALSDKSTKRIRDPDLKVLWEQQGWKASVEVRNFVLALNDYYADQFEPAEEAGMHESAATSEAGSRPPSPTSPVHDPPAAQDDRWTLAYINVAHIQPISEAVDDDLSGFISSKEANTFAAQRPENWSLPQWTAFWAAGWHLIVICYRNRIYKLLQAVNNLVRQVLPTNRNYAESYYGQSTIDQIELLLGSTPSASDMVLSDPNLVRLVQEFQDTEEVKLKARLETLLYQVDDSTAIALLTRRRRRRIERYVYPLLYLLLKRHVDILRLACIHTLEEAEFMGMITSLDTVFTAVEDRIKVLEGKFQMLHNPHSGQSARSSTIRSFIEEDGYEWGNQDISTDSDIEEEGRMTFIQQIPKAILRHGQFRFPDRFSEFEKRFPLPNPPINAAITSTSAMNGSWTCLASGDSWVPSPPALLTLVFAISGDELTIGAETLQHVYQVPGTMKNEHEVTFRIWYTDYVGVYDPATETIQVKRDSNGSDEEEEGILGSAARSTLRRTPPAAHRHLYTPAELKADPIKARWNFALAAVHADVQRKNCSGAYLRARNAERKRWVELTVLDNKVTENYKPATPLTAEEKDELAQLTAKIPPRDIRFYDVLASFEMNKTIILHYASCNACRGSIYGERLACLECMDDNEDFNRVDLCSNCFEQTAEWRAYVHEPRHVQVKTYRRINPGDMSWMVPKEREVAKRVKKLFTADKAVATTAPASDPSGEGVTKDIDVPVFAERLATETPTCTYCEGKIALPCFVCVECTPDAYICIECNKKHAAIFPQHRLSHPLVYIFDTKEMILPKTPNTEDATATVEVQLAAMRSHMQTLEKNMGNKFEATRSHMQTLEKNIGNKFEALDARLEAVEVLLHNVLKQLTGEAGEAKGE